MSMATQISLVIKRQNWIKSKINNLVYNKSNIKYYGKLDSIQSYIRTKNFVENVLQNYKIFQMIQKNLMKKIIIIMKKEMNLVMKDTINLENKRITIQQVARILGKSDEFVRVGLQRGILPFGTAYILPRT